MNVSTTSTIETYMDSPSAEPSLGHLSRSTLSMRAKSQRKRKVSALHNSNFRAGFVPVNEEALHKSGIRGRKRYFLYCTLAIMMVIALLNTMVTVWLIYILGVTHVGMSSYEVSSYGMRTFVRMLQRVDMITITMDKAPLGARFNSSLDFTTEDSALYIQSSDTSNVNSVLSLEGTTITLTTDNMHINIGKNKRQFTPDLITITESSRGVTNLFADSLTTRQIYNTKGKDDILILESQINEVLFNASAGLTVESKHDLRFAASADINLLSEDNITMSAGNIYLSADLPRVKKKKADPDAYKLCICANGKIFLVPRDKVSCRVGKNDARKVCRKSRK